MRKFYKISSQTEGGSNFKMSERNFINMDSEMVADSLQWWVDYHENDEDKRDYFDTEEEAFTFYHTFPKGTPPQ